MALPIYIHSVWNFQVALFDSFYAPVIFLLLCWSYRMRLVLLTVGYLFHPFRLAALLGLSWYLFALGVMICISPLVIYLLLFIIFLFLFLLFFRHIIYGLLFIALLVPNEIVGCLQFFVLRQAFKNSSLRFFVLIVFSLLFPLCTLLIFVLMLALLHFCLPQPSDVRVQDA